MARILCGGTVQLVFRRLEGCSGVNPLPASIEINKFEEAAFVEAFHKLNEIKLRLEAQDTDLLDKFVSAESTDAG